MLTKNLVIPLLLIASIFGFESCVNNGSERKHEKVDMEKLEEELIYANKRAVIAEMDRIQDYLKRYQLKMDTTGTGLHYLITKPGNGPKGELGKIIEMDYTLKFLWGDTAYTSKLNGPLVFEIGHGNVESGLEELALLLKEGDHVKSIIPSFLGYGLVGDGNKIPGKATLVYDLHVVSVKTK